MDKINIMIKPHHLLDIFKLYGKGIEVFVPDEKFHHDFYAVANGVIENRVGTVQFTYGYDDICKPCICLQNHVCTDTFSYHDIVHDKNAYNEMLDKKLIRLLGLDTDTAYEFSAVIHLLHRKLNLELINAVWDENSPGENKSRYDNTKKGLEQYIRSSSRVI